MLTALLSFFSGGALAFLPHLIDMGLDYFKQKQADAHELAVMDKQIAAQAALGAQRLEEVRTESFAQAAVAEQNRLAASERPSGVKWVDALTAAIRPALTILVVANYVVYKWKMGLPWGEDDMTMVISIFSFWFGDRLASKMRAS